MTGQQLKNSILQMAVQGKLVPQDPNDEPASVLLERIRKEKEKLTKEGKIKKEKNSSYIFRGADNLPYEKVGNNEPVCIADEIPFDIPDSWEWIRLGSTIELQSGQDMTPDKYNDNGNGIPYITGASNIIDGSIIINRWTTCGKAFAHRGDILLTCKGTVGTMAILQEEIVHIARQIMAIRPIGELYVPYMQLVLETMVENLKAAAKSMIPGISRNDVLASLFPVPPLNEQHRIIAKLKEVGPCIHQYKKSESTLRYMNNIFPEALKKSILQWAVQGKLVPQDPNDEPAEALLERIRAEKQRLIKEGKIKKDKHESIIYRRDNSYYEKLDGIERCIDDEIPFEIPESWEWSRLSLVSNMYTENSINEREKKLKYMGQTEGLPYIGTKDVGIDYTIHYDNGVRIPFYANKFRVAPAESVLLCIEGGSAGRKISFTNQKVCFGNKLCCFAPLGINYRFLFYYLQCPLFLGLFKEQTSGIIGGVGLNTLKRMYLPIPPLAEQQRIARRLDSLFNNIDALRQQ